jgi:predicted site-specific integrase-resolvase
VSLQEHFDRTFISSSEVCQRLGIARSTLFHGARSGKLPEAIIIKRANGVGAHIMLWERDKAEPMLQEWSKAIDARKAQ